MSLIQGMLQIFWLGPIWSLSRMGKYIFSVFLSLLIDDRIKEGSNVLLEHQH
jgi:hypothetical protein